MARKVTQKGLAKKKGAGGSRAARPAQAARDDKRPARAARPAQTKGAPGAKISAKRGARAAKISATPISAAPGRKRSRLSLVPPPPTEIEVATTATYLTPDEVEEFRQLLAEKRSQLVGDVGTLQDEALKGNRREATGDLSSMPLHMADLGTDNYELEFTLGLLEGGRATLQEIDEALERIRKGTYGVCAATGKPIGKARLRAKPWAKYCYEHTLAIEKGKRHGS